MRKKLRIVNDVIVDGDGNVVRTLLDSEVMGIVLEKTFSFTEISGAPGETRTPNPLLRRQMLYPFELQAPGLILR